MTREFVLTHPDAPKSQNAGGGGSRRHWAVAHREKKQWEGIFLALLLKERVPQGMSFCEATAVIRWKQRYVGGRERDSTNYLASVIKPLADVLAPPSHLYIKEAGKKIAVPNHAPRWLPDDTDEFFSFRGLSFEYPSPWPFADPRVKAELIVHLSPAYPSSPQPSAPQGDAGA